MRLPDYVQQVCAREGARIAAVVKGGSGHLKVAIEVPGKGQRTLIVSCTPSDHRAALNNKSDLRKLIWKLQGKIQ